MEKLRLNLKKEVATELDPNISVLDKKGMSKEEIQNTVMLIEACSIESRKILGEIEEDNRK